jgi:hypothetical protein
MTAGVGTQFRIFVSFFFFNFICRGYQAPETMGDDAFIFFNIRFIYLFKNVNIKIVILSVVTISQ